MNRFKNYANRILILFAHPAFEKSRVNRTLARAVNNLDGVTFHDLYERYPEFDIDVAYEQGLLLAHGVVIFHHPFFWYSTPAILKEWQDLVLEHGWAYGCDGTALQGKTMFNVISTGGSEAAYQKEGFNQITIRELLAPIERTAVLCGMEYLPPFVVHDTHAITGDDIRRHAHDYRRFVEALRDGRVDMGAARQQARVNANLESIISNKKKDS